jgi:hypothetical protein
VIPWVIAHESESAFPYIIGFEYYGGVNASEIVGPPGNISIPSSGVSCEETAKIDVEYTP